MLVTTTFLYFFLCSFKLGAVWPYKVKPLPNDKFLDVTKLKAFANDKLKVARMMISLLDRAEDTVGKGENDGYQHFLLFPQCFSKLSSLELLKGGVVW